MKDHDVREFFKERLNHLLETSRTSQKELAQKLGVSTSTVSSWVLGDKMTRVDKLDAIAEYFSVKRSDLLVNKVEIGTPYNPSKRIPVLGRISTGTPLYCEENIVGYTYTDLNGSENEYFALRASGNSMNASRICDGDLVIVRRQSSVDNGQIAVVMVGDDEATIKRFYANEDSITLMPQSTDPSFLPQIYNLAKTKVTVLGLVVKIEIRVSHSVVMLLHEVILPCFTWLLPSIFSCFSLVSVTT